MKKLFVGLVVLIALSSCENRELTPEKEDAVFKTNKTVDEQNYILPSNPTDTTGVGPVVTIPPR